MGYIPKRSSLAIGIRDEEDLDRSFREINKEERTITKNTKRYKTNKDPSATDTTDTEQIRTQGIEDARTEKSERERINEIKYARALIIEATNKMSAGKIQFNRTEQSIDQVQVEIMTSHLINLIEKMANKKTTQTEKTVDTDTHKELRRMNQENRRQYQEIWKSLNKVEKTLSTLQRESENNEKRGASMKTNTTDTQKKTTDKTSEP